MRDVKRTSTYCLMFIGAGLISGSLGPSLIYLSQLVSASVAEISILFSARAIGNMLGALIAGRIYDRIKGHHYLIAMLLLAAVVVVCVPFVSSLWLLMGIFAVMGFAEVSINTGGNLMTLWLHRDKAASALSLLHLFYSLGNMIAPLILIFGGWLGGDYSAGFWMIAAYTLIFPIFLLRQESPRYLVDCQTPVEKVFDKTFFMCFLLMAFLYVSFEITVAGWIATYATLKAVPETQAAILVTWFFVALSAGRLLSVSILRWLSVVQVIWILQAFSFVGVLSLLLNIPLVISVLLLGFGCSAIFPFAFSFANQVITLSGKLMGYVFVCCGLGSMIVPSLTGPLIEWLGAQVFPFIVLCILCAFVFVWWQLLRLKGRNDAANNRVCNCC